MKTRDGFVSNSSSSSFIVAASHFNPEKHIATNVVDLSTHIDEVISSKEELDSIYKRDVGFVPKFSKIDLLIRDIDPPYPRVNEKIEQYLQILKKIQEGKQVAFGFFSDNDGSPPMETGLTYGGIEEYFDSVEVIKDTDGY